MCISKRICVCAHRERYVLFPLHLTEKKAVPVCFWAGNAQRPITSMGEDSLKGDKFTYGKQSCHLSKSFDLKTYLQMK